MRLFLVRHGEYEAGGAAKGLSDAGRRSARRVAAFLSSAGAAPEEIRHSAKLRALQTAEILAEALGAAARVREAAGLAPNDPVAEVARELDEERRDLMLVGHLPHLERLASLLAFGDEDLRAFDLPPAGVICLVRRGASLRPRFGLRWMVVPQILP